MMRALALTSPDARGRITEAEATVGEITFGGTMFFIMFVGLATGTLGAIIFLVTRHWLPGPRRTLGWMFGFVLLSLNGFFPAIFSNLSSRNPDFQILGPVWLAITLNVALFFIYGIAFVAIHQKFERALSSRGDRLNLTVAFAPLIAPPLAMIGIPLISLATFTIFRVDRNPSLGAKLQGRRATQIGQFILSGICAIGMIGVIRMIGEII